MYEASCSIGNRELKARGETEGEAVMRLVEMVKETRHYRELVREFSKF